MGKTDSIFSWHCHTWRWPVSTVIISESSPGPLAFGGN